MKKMLLAMLHCKCPRCYQGDMFKYRLRSLKNPIKPNAECAHCGLHYELEPGFFWGAMYFSYAISVGVSVLAAADDNEIDCLINEKMIEAARFAEKVLILRKPLYALDRTASLEY